MPESIGTPQTPLFQGAFFENFLAISRYETIIGLLILAIAFWIIYRLQKRKSSFFMRMSVGLIFGALIGLGIQAWQGFPDQANIVLKETATWYGLFGRTFIAFIRMLVIPLVFVSIVKVILDFGGDQRLTKVARRGIFWLLFTTGIAALLGIFIANIMNLGYGDALVETAAKEREYTTLVDTFVNLVPNNIISAMNNNNIIGLVIFSALVGVAANRMRPKAVEAIAIFQKLIDALHKIVMSITMTIIKYMPYAIIALLAGTIMTNGIPAVIKVSSFVIAIYVATFIMIMIHLLIIAGHGLSPLMFLRKSRDTLVMAFSSRSSVGTLPLAISTLTERMGVSGSTANLIPSLGTTMGMNGCAGFFPALLVMMVAHMVGIETDLQFYIMLLIVIVIGSIGIAGVPGTATIAATIALSGMGMGEYFPLIGMVLAIDPMIDMGRTMTNISGALTASVVTDKELGLLNQERFQDPNAFLESGEQAS
ncbi:sodium:dicarboxylate symporter [Ignatzschineria indica]|uniref:Sodium:dicarboxylate symporter n=1 Tax=Ignatzschineria indica TaxID=472583 RepID=A0A2U2AME2_9GAMM|nr:cation:dicarboxylase symporter family transporter [Ignatzschineria indica]PWD84307.1 sodium:dicarboxylate symporter [Ignatzschineria indica]GGZ75416.1 sodium:dicarboxylate symporter [Ignatzschineria indica]